MIRILIADDHAIFRQALRRLLEADAGMTVVGEAADFREALSLVREVGPDVVLLDVAMPGRGAVETIEELRRRLPSARVLMLSAQPEDQFAVRYLQAGAAGYVSKVSSSDELVEAIRKVHAGRKVISPELAERIAFAVGPEPSLRPHEKLSAREYEVMRLLAAGRRPSDIATDLCLSVKTISTYRSRILQKMNLTNNAEIILYAAREGLLE